MQLASFLAPPLKTMDSLLQAGRESFGLEGPGCALDLHYRVMTVRLWATSTQLDGVQFVYRHCMTGEERDGVQLETDSLACLSPPQLEIDLLEEEFIAHVHVLQKASIVTTLVLVTSTGRRFQAGAPTVESPKISVVPYTEVRELRGRLSRARDAFASVSPVTMLQPHAEAIQAIVDEAVIASANRWWYPERCRQLALHLRGVGNAVQGVVDRGIVYPVGVLCEFAEVAQVSQAVIISCGQAVSMDYVVVPRGLAIDGYVSRLTMVAEWLRDEIPKAELASLEVGDPVDSLDDQSVPRMVRQALKTSQRTIAVKLCCKYPAFLVGDEALIQQVVDVLIDTEDCLQIVGVVDAYVQPANVSVAAFMARFTTRQPPLAERAVQWEQPVLLEWLVRDARLDPFDSPLAKTTSTVNVEGDETTQRKHRTQNEAQRDRLFELVDCVQDKDAQKRMRDLLTHLKKKDDFHNGLLALATQDNVTTGQFQALVPHVTSVYDLPLLFSQAKASFHDGDRKRGLSALVKTACDHVVENKLVLDTKASAFFNVALRQANDHGHLSSLEHEHYRILNSQINMETAAWVVELKRMADHMQWRVDRLDNQVESLQRNIQELRESLRRNEEIEMNRRKCRRNWALVSSMLVMVGGGAAVYALQDMFEPVDPTLLLSAGDSDFLDDIKSTASGLLGGGTGEAFMDNVKSTATGLLGGRTGEAGSLLGRMGSSASELLGSGTGDVSSLLGRMGSSCSSLADLPTRGPAGLDLLQGFAGFDMLGSLGNENNKTAEIVGVMMTAAELCNVKTAVQQTRVTFDEKKIRQHPYHDAVRASLGDLQQFKALEKCMSPNADVNDDFDVTVAKVRSDGATTKTSRMPAYMMASYLGYVDIVEYLLTNKNLTRREWKLITKRRARKAQKSNNSSNNNNTKGSCSTSGVNTNARRFSTPVP